MENSIFFGYEAMREKAGERYIDEFLHQASMKLQCGRDSEKDFCIVAYMKQLIGELQGISCGKCTLCRLSINQLKLIFDDAVSGEGKSDDISMIRLLCEALEYGTDCEFGKKAAAFIECTANENLTEIEEHIVQRTCRAMVCGGGITYHILGVACRGCGACLDACTEQAINGKPGYIHMIDNDACIKCGTCLEVCPNHAIESAGAVKPKCPDRLTKVGHFRNRK